MKSFLTSPDLYLSILNDKEANYRTLEDAANKTTTRISGLPSGGGQDRNALLASLADAKAEYYRWLHLWQDHSRDVRNFASRVVIPETRRIIIWQRYINRLPWAEILPIINKRLEERGRPPISERQMYYEHLKALEDSAEWINITGKYLFIGLESYNDTERNT